MKLADDCPCPGPIKGTCPDCPYGSSGKRSYAPDPKPVSSKKKGKRK